MSLNSKHPDIAKWIGGGAVVAEAEDRFQTLFVLVRREGKGIKKYELLRAWETVYNQGVMVSLDMRTTDLEEIASFLVAQKGA